MLANRFYDEFETLFGFGTSRDERWECKAPSHCSTAVSQMLKGRFRITPSAYDPDEHQFPMPSDVGFKGCSAAP
jgi:hypothetical protein